MRVRKALRRLAFGALVAGLVLPVINAQASGVVPTINDKAADVVDFLKHTQNSFRPANPGTPWTQYQYACRPDSLAQVANCNPFDVRTTRAVSDSTTQKITFTMTLNGAAPQPGDPLTVLPAPFSSVNYAFYFATSRQEVAHEIGRSCIDNEDDLTIEDVGVKIDYTFHASCGKAADDAAESDGLASGTEQVSSNTPVLTVPHPKGDGWLAVAEVEAVPAAHGSPKGNGVGTVVCDVDPATGQRYPVCIDYDMQVGDYEGYSGFSETQDMRDFDDLTQAKMGFSVSGNTITVTMPWNPTVIGATDGDLLIDDRRSFPWVLGGSTDKITALIGETTGVVQAGANTVTQVSAICPDDSDNIVPESQEPIKGVGKAIGDVNRAIGDATGQWIIGTGGHDQGDCIRGIYGLLTLLDWAPDDGFELRQLPRQPGYLPNPTPDGLSCRYPIGHFPAAPAPVTMEQLFVGPISSPGISADTSPFDEAYTVRVYAGSATPAHSQAGQVLPNPAPAPVDPLAAFIGKDRACNYTFWPYGIHYFDKLSPDVPF